MPRARLRLLLALPLIFLATVAAFIPALTAGFCDFDDPGFLLLNPHWRGLSASNIVWMFTNTHLGHYQPLTFLSYAIEYALFHTSPRPVRGVNVDLNPLVLHATNIALHALNAVLVCVLTFRVLGLARVTTSPGEVENSQDDPRDFGNLIPALLAGLLWGVHPLRVESVAWITERRDVLSAFFLLAAALAYLSGAAPGVPARRADRWRRLALALLLASLLSKAWGMTFFVLALLLDIYPLRRLPWQPWRWLGKREVLVEKIPFAALGVVFAVVAAHAQKVASAGQTLKTLDDWGVVARLAQACYGLWFYLSRSVWPHEHALIVELPTRFDAGETRWMVGVGFTLIAGAGVLVASRRRPGLGVATLAFLVLVSPVLGFVQSGVQLVAERYSYLAMIPLTMALAAGVTQRPRLARAGAALLALACVVLGVLTWRQSGVWHSTRALWEQSIASGSKGPMVHNFLGRAMEKSKDDDAAMEEYRKSLAADATFGDSYMGLGLIYSRRGQFLEAETNLLLAERYLPDPSAAQLQLGLMYRKNPATQREAIEAFERAVASTERLGNPANSGATYLNLASAYGEAGDDQRAFETLQKAAMFPDTRADALSLIQQMQGR